MLNKIFGRDLPHATTPLPENCILVPYTNILAMISQIPPDFSDLFISLSTVVVLVDHTSYLEYLNIMKCYRHGKIHAYKKWYLFSNRFKHF